MVPSLSLPSWGGGYHLVGDVTTIDDVTVTKLVTLVSGILKTVGMEPKVIPPPPPT